MHTLSAVLVLTGLVSNLLTVQGREDGHVATENCKKALLAETSCDLNSSKCICNYLDNNTLSHWTRELCDEADISIKTLYKDICTDHPFLFPLRASAPMVRVGDSSPKANDNNDETDKETPFTDKMSSLVAFPSSPASSPTSSPTSFPVASAVAIAKAAGVMGGGGVRHPPNIQNRAVQPQPEEQKPYTDATGMIHMPIVYKTVTTTHTRTECLCDTGPGGATASASVSGGESDSDSTSDSSKRVEVSAASTAAETTPTPTGSSHATMMESSAASSSSSSSIPQTPVPAPAPAAPTSTMLIGSPSSSGVFGSSSHGVLAGTKATEATSPTMSSTTPVSESDLDSETLAEAVPTGVDPQRSGAGEVEEDRSRTTHAYESSAARGVYGYRGVGGVVVGVVGVIAVLML